MVDVPGVGNPVYLIAFLRNRWPDLATQLEAIYEIQSEQAGGAQKEDLA